MNDSPEGTPNPLKQNPGVAPVEQGATPPAPEPAPTPAPAPEPVAPAPAPTPAPAEEPKGSMVEPAKKSKKPALIVAIVLFVVALIAGAAAAIIFFDPFGMFGSRKDAVPAAIAKLFSDEAPNLVSIDGNVKLVANDSSSPFSTLTVKFKTDGNAKTTENSTSATVTAVLRDGTNFSFNVDEVKPSGNDLYLKLSGVSKALENMDNTNCIDGEEGTNCGDEIDVDVIDCDVDDDDCMEVGVDTDTIMGYIEIFEVIDDEWIYIPGSTFDSVTDMTSVNDTTQCLIDAAGKMDKYDSDFTTMYKNNSFITYSTDNLKIAQKKDPLYRLGIDEEKMAGFINSMNNSGFMNEMLACTGGEATNQEVTAADLKGITSVLPAIYVEIDGKNNFTRVYLSMSDDSGNFDVTADLSLSYPDKVTIEEPGEYIEINEVINRILTALYGEDVYKLN